MNNSGGSLQTSGIVARLFFYMIGFSFFAIIVFTILGLGEEQIPFTGIDNLDYILHFVLITLPFIWTEHRIRAFRKNFNLPIYKNVIEEVNQLVLEERILNEQKAYEEVQKPIIDTNRLDYWFNLKEKGAISEEEYNSKKKELLAN